MAELHELLSSAVIQDLAKSGLKPSDMRVRPFGANEKAATNAGAHQEGYVIPYFDMYGKPIPFYRARLFDSDIKYKQLVNTANHIYFPPGLAALLPKARYIILTEGEKKAAAAVKAGHPCIAVGGVDSWRNRTLIISKDTKLGQDPKGNIIAKLPSGQDPFEKVEAYAEGFQGVIDFIANRKIPLVICYDTDGLAGIKPEVQRAAASLGFELRFRGIPSTCIRQLILRAPADSEAARTGAKLGIDDFLEDDEIGPVVFQRQLDACLAKRNAFPRHPNPKEYLNKKLQQTHMTRQQTQSLATAVLCDLDARGLRLRCPDNDNLYYFDQEGHELIKVDFNLKNEGYAKTPFGVKLYKDYNLSAADFRVLQWLSAQYSGEDPIVDVHPERVLTLRADTLYYQLSDGQTVKVTADRIDVVDNGSDDILFEAGLVEGIKANEFATAIKEVASLPFECWWYTVLKEARIKDSEEDRARKILALLYSISPWFYRWRDTQLPFEMTVGEPGSGKSTLYTLRLDILTGQPILRNAPKDMRDWTASVAATGGLHVTDNVHMSNGSMKQELSDELCRIITEPNPHVERRKLYTDDQLVRTAVKSVFAVTAVKQPFTNTDIIQRAIITELDKGVDVVTYDADWEKHQLVRFGGRTHWLAHQMIFMNKMFKLIKEKWQDRYKAKYRLINVEQLLVLAAEVYGWDGSWIPQYLEGARDKKTSETDWALAGLQWWTDEVRARSADCSKLRFGTNDIAQQFEGHEDFGDCNILTNPRSLGKYLATNKNMVSQLTGIEPAGLQANRQVYLIRKTI